MDVGKRSNAEPSKKLDAQTEAMLGIITGGSKPEDAARNQREAEAMRNTANAAKVESALKEKQAQFDSNTAIMARTGGSEAAKARQEELRREMSKLTDELRRLREATSDKRAGDATVDKMSAVGEGAFAGARVQTASFGVYGSMARVGRGLAQVGEERSQIWGGGAGGGYGGAGGGGRAPDAAELPGAPPRRSPGRPGDPRGVPAPQSGPFPGRNFGGGKFNVLSGVPLVEPRRGGPADQIGRSLRGERPETMPEDRGMLDLIAAAEGTTKRGYDDSFAHQLQGTLTDKSLGEIEQIQRGMRGSSAIGKYQFMRNTLFGSRGRPGLTDELGISRDEKFTPELQDRLGNALIERRYKEAQRNHARSGGEFMSHFRTALAREWASFPGDYGQQGINGGMYPGQKASISRDRLTGAAQRWLDEREGRTKKAVPAGPRETADGAGWAARERARREFEASERLAPNSTAAFAEAVRKRRAESEKQGYDFAGDGGRKLMEKASRTPMLAGGATLNATGSVGVYIKDGGPDMKVSTSASGNLFREVRLRRGNPMTPSEDD